MNQGFAPIRRGLLDHLCTMSSNGVKLYLFLHLTALWHGTERGTVETAYAAIGAALGWSVRTVKRTMAELHPRYIDVVHVGDQHRPTVIRIRNYDGAGAKSGTSSRSAGVTGGTGTRVLVPENARAGAKSGTSTSQTPNKHEASGAPKNLELKDKKYPSSSESKLIRKLEVPAWAK